VTPSRLLEQDGSVSPLFGEQFRKIELPGSWERTTNRPVGALNEGDDPGFINPKGAALVKGKFSKLAIANPKLAP